MNQIDFGGSYGAGGNFRQVVTRGVKEHELSIGALGFLGASWKWDSKGNLTYWYFGLDVSAKMAFGVGIMGGAKLEFRK